MSGFGLRAFKKLKDENEAEEKKQFYPHIVYGENAFSVLTFLKLKEKYGNDKVKLVCQNFIDKQSILSEWKCSLNTLRDEQVAKLLMEKRPQLEVIPDKHPVKFYKDSKFHEFGGRTKSFEIKEGEQYFKSSFFDYKALGLFSDEQWNELDQVLNGNQLNKYIEKIELTDPADLVEKTHFRLHTGEFESLECENLYWCESPKTFYKKVENKDKLNDALAEYCTSLNHRAALVVYFQVDAKVFEHKGTVFLPQSVTHEWGHFICDFKEFDPVSETQQFSSMMFVNEDEVNEEELAKKIRLMKRVIERTMPEFAKVKHSEHIHYSESMFINNIKDELKDDIEFDHAELKFVGQAAPIGADDAQRIKYTPRSILSLSEI